MANFKLSRNSKRNIKGIDKRLIELVERSLKLSDHDFGIPNNGGLRTAQEQNNLFHKRPKVTWLDGFNKKSYHQSGNAFDIFLYDEHGACWDCIDKYKDIAKTIFAEFKKMQEECIFSENEELRWGGNWKRFRDYPHFELR